MGLDARLQVSARHQLHGVEVEALSLAILIHGDDVGMAEPGCGPHLPLEALNPLRVPCKLRWNSLQGHLAAEALVLGPEHVGHASTTQ